MKCPNCQRVRTLRRAEEKNADLVACDACGARFKILRNNRAQPHVAKRASAKKQRSRRASETDDASTNKTSKTKFVPVPPPVIDLESLDDATLLPTSPPKTVEEYREREEEYDDKYEKIAPSFVDAATRQAKNFVIYFSQEVSTRYFLGIGLYFLGISLILGAVAFTFSAGEAFRIFIRFIGLTFSFLAFTAALTVLARRFSVFERPLNFTWRFLAIIAPLIVATLALAPAWRAPRRSESLADAAVATVETVPTDEENDAETSTRRVEVGETPDVETDSSDAANGVLR